MKRIKEYCKEKIRSIKKGVNAEVNMKNSKEIRIEKGKQFRIVRNYLGNISPEEFIARVAKAYIEKEKSHEV